MPYDAPERPPRAFFFEANEDYCQLGLEPEIHFKLCLGIFSRKFPLQHAELLTYAAIDPTQSDDPWNRKLSAFCNHTTRNLEYELNAYFHSEL